MQKFNVGITGDCSEAALILAPNRPSRQTEAAKQDTCTQKKRAIFIKYYQQKKKNICANEYKTKHKQFGCEVLKRVAQNL